MMQLQLEQLQVAVGLIWIDQPGVIAAINWLLLERSLHAPQLAS
jgi:hypothetical protein